MIAKHTLRPDQEEAVSLLIAEPTKAALIASDMGRGKTTVASEFVARMGLERVLYVGVKDTFGQWAERLEAQSDGAIVLRRVDSTKPGKEALADMLAGKPGHFFTGSQYLTTQDYRHDPVLNGAGEQTTNLGPKIPTGTATFAVDAAGVVEKTKVTKTKLHLGTYKKMKAFDCIVWDECHVFANKRSDAFRTAKTLKSEWKIAMSGTPYGNRFQNSWSICRWLWKDLIDPSSVRWISDWCVSETRYLKGKRTVENVTGERSPGEFVKTLPLYIRAEAEEQPPAPRLVYVDLTPEQRAQYDALEEDMLVWLESHQGLAPLVADLPITLRSRLRTATLGSMSFSTDGEIGFGVDCDSSKLHALRGILDHPLYVGRQVAVYTDSKKFAKITVARMRAAGYNAVEWSGDVTSKQRDEIKRAFLAGEIQYLVCVIAAFSTGLDGFQTVCSRVVWLSESEDNSINAQAIARFFRPGRLGDFEHCKILANDTHDVGIYGRLVQQSLNRNATLRYELAA